MAYQPQIEFYKTRQFGEKLNMAFVFLRENARPYLKAQVLIAGPILLIANIIASKYSADLIGFDPVNATANDILSIFNVFGVALISTVVTGAIMPSVTYGYMRTYQANAPVDITLNMVSKGVASKVFNVLGFNILTALIVGAGMLFFFFPAVYLLIVLSLGAAIIVFENSNPIDAISRSFSLIRGKWWSTFGLVVVMVIINYLISMLFGLPRAITFGIEAFTTALENNDPKAIAQEMSELTSTEQFLSILFSIIETFGSILTYSLTYLALAFQYFNLVERNESRGLMGDIEGLDSEVDNSSDEEVY